jgi:hypothetical protein
LHHEVASSRSREFFVLLPRELHRLQVLLEYGDRDGFPRTHINIDVATAQSRFCDFRAPAEIAGRRRVGRRAASSSQGDAPTRLGSVASPSCSVLIWEKTAARFWAA